MIQSEKRGKEGKEKKKRGRDKSVIRKKKKWRRGRTKRGEEARGKKRDIM